MNILSRRVVSLFTLSCLLSAAVLFAQTSVIDEELILEDEAIIPFEESPADSANPSDDTLPSAAEEEVDIKEPVDVADEELILDGGAEELLLPTGRAAEAAAKDTAGTHAETENASVSGAVTGDDGENIVDEEMEVGEAEDGIAAPVAPVPEEASVTIDKVRSVNFARNLKEYRSPRLAMLLSLILPGAGQVYAKANLQAVGFVAVEAVAIAAGTALASKSKKTKKNARSFADDHYSADKRFVPYTDSLKAFLETKFPGKADSVYWAIFDLATSDTQFVADAALRNDAYYDNLIGSESPFIRGWDDVEPPFGGAGYVLSDSVNHRVVDSGFYLVPTTDTLGHVYGVSVNQDTYTGMLDDARKWANYSRLTFTSLMVNHIASAVMAGIAAKRHNDALLERESFWQRIDLRNRQVNTGSEIVQGYAFEVRF